MLYDLFSALLTMFQWLVIGIFGMAGLGLVFVGIPAFRGQRRHVKYVKNQKKIRAEKEFKAHLATFYTADSDDAEFFSKIQKHIFDDKIVASAPEPTPIFDTSIDAVLRDEAMRFLSGETVLQNQPPTLFEESLGTAINCDYSEFLGQDQPRLLRDKMTTFFKNADGNTDGFQQLP